MAKVYVGTYEKYNNGSIAGAWVDLEQFDNIKGFLTHCAELHKDEADPELMFQDFEDFPRQYYGESYISPELWDWLALDDFERDVVAAYQSGIDSNGSIGDAQDAFNGFYPDKMAWADQYIDDTGLLDSIPENLRCYFDTEKWLRDVEFEGSISFVEYNDEIFVFTN